MSEEKETPKPSESIKIETENIFDPSLLDSAGYPLPLADDPFSDDPMKMLREMMGDLKDMVSLRGPFALPSMPQSEHKVRIYQLCEEYNLEAVEAFAAEIEDFLNEGYCCHTPTVVGNYVIMDFSRRKDIERQERQTNNNGSDKETA